MLSRGEELELARILLSLSETSVSNHRVTRSMAHIQAADDDEVSSAGGECDSDSEEDDIYGADLDDDGDGDYAPSDDESVDDNAEEDGEESVGDEDEEDEDYVPSDGEEESVDDNEDDEEYVPEEDTDEMEQLVRDACSSLARRTKLPSGFRWVLDEARAGNLPAHFVEWMNTIPPISHMLNL